MLIHVKDVEVSVFHHYTSSLKKERKEKKNIYIYIYIYVQNEWGVSKNEWMIKNAKLRTGLVIETLQ